MIVFVFVDDEGVFVVVVIRPAIFYPFNTAALGLKFLHGLLIRTLSFRS